MYVVLGLGHLNQISILFSKSIPCYPFNRCDVRSDVFVYKLSDGSPILIQVVGTMARTMNIVKSQWLDGLGDGRRSRVMIFKRIKTGAILQMNINGVLCTEPLHYLLKPVKGLNLTGHINFNGVLCTKKRIMTKCEQVWNVFTHLGHYPLVRPSPKLPAALFHLFHNCYSQQPKPHPIKFRVAEHLVDMLVHYNQVLEVKIRSSYLLFFVLYSDFAESTSSIIPTVPKSGSGAQNRNQEEAEEAGAFPFLFSSVALMIFDI
ncbi:hypothetical protein LXL04_038831 [Taraxacum kok-saghyz]